VLSDPECMADAAETRYSILIVEDDTSGARALSEKLGREGYEIFFARDGHDGLESALEKHPDLVLLDIIMPRMDGLTMLKELRLDEWGRDVPVILLTNLNDDKSITAGKESGVRDYLVKTNWTMSDLLDVIRLRLQNVPDAR
jgi:CheY-like chemotaxis protein